MKTQRFFVLLAFSVSTIAVFGQSSAATSREPEKKQSIHAPRHARTDKVHRKKVTHTKEYEFYERVEKAAKEKQRLLRKLAKPQYSDRRYFGHKRIPKRKPAHKMRYCEECGIRH